VGSRRDEVGGFETRIEAEKQEVWSPVVVQAPPPQGAHFINPLRLALGLQPSFVRSVGGMNERSKRARLARCSSHEIRSDRLYRAF
jgi:hypothetical protein